MNKMSDNLKIVTAEEAVAIVKSNNKIFFQGAAMTPNLFSFLRLW